MEELVPGDDKLGTVEQTLNFVMMRPQSAAGTCTRRPNSELPAVFRTAASAKTTSVIAAAIPRSTSMAPWTSLPTAVGPSRSGNRCICIN